MAFKKLLIAIPTYNRKSQLIRLLKSLESQDCIELYDIIISDNCSNYSVGEAISASFKENFVKNIRIIRRTFNAGGDRNISSLFSYATDYELLWTIGDDDETSPDSIKTIIKQYEENPDIAFFKYSISQNFGPKKDEILQTVEDLDLCVKKGYCTAGDLIFVSNNVYNVNLLRNYFPDCQYYGYCSIAQILPLIRCLIENSHPVMLCKHSIVKYYAPEGDAWNYIKIATSLGTFADIQWNNNHKATMKCLNILSKHFGIGQFLLHCIDIKDKSYRKYVCKKARISIFKRSKSPIDWFSIVLYNIEVNIHIPLFSLIYKTLYTKQEAIKQILKEKAKDNHNIEKLKIFLKKYCPKLH